MAQPSTTIGSGQATVGTSATLIAPYNKDRQSVLITNTGAVSVFIGPAGITSSTGGGPIPAGESQRFTTVAAIYGATGSSTAVCSFLEEVN